MTSSQGSRAVSTMGRNLSAAAESVNSAGFSAVVGGGERLAFEQRKQMGGPRKRQATRLERAPMVRRDAEPADAVEMLGGRISDIGRPAVTGIAARQGAHDSVARHFGDHRGGGDREGQRI